MNHRRKQVVAEKIGSTVRVLELLGFEYRVGPPKRVKGKGNYSPRVVTVELGMGNTVSVYSGFEGSTWANDTTGEPIREVKSIEDLYDYLKKLPDMNGGIGDTSVVKREVRGVSELMRAIETLTRSSRRRPPPSRNVRSGVYAIRLREPGLLAPVIEDDTRLLYIGMSSDLAAREFDTHFDSGQTGFSTVRRSIGSVLKSELRLIAVQNISG